MAWPHPQPWQDWLTQAWNIACGRRLTEADAWLQGPGGEIGVSGEALIERLAVREGLSVDRANRVVGLMDGFAEFPQLAGRVRPEIVEFYTRTPAYAFDVWSEWKPGWGAGGRLVTRLFSRRIGQLNLPGSPLATAAGITSEVILLREPDGRPRHRVWLRRLRSTGAVIYVGFYGTTVRPAGEPCLKIAFPLPCGSATVVMRATAGADGRLVLESRGDGYGDAGFYFLVADRRGQWWQHYLRSFRERIEVFVDDAGQLRADHTMSLWGRTVFALHYKITRRIGDTADAE